MAVEEYSWLNNKLENSYVLNKMWTEGFRHSWSKTEVAA